MKKYTFPIATAIVLSVVGYVLYSMATVSVPSPEARDNQRKYELQQIHQLLALSYELNNRFPASLDEIQESPEGPGNVPYSYELASGGRDYKACATMEDKSVYCVTSKSQF